jgi:hypothetical protein
MLPATATNRQRYFDASCIQLSRLFSINKAAARQSSNHSVATVLQVFEMQRQMAKGHRIIILMTTFWRLYPTAAKVTNAKSCSQTAAKTQKRDTSVDK